VKVLGLGAIRYSRDLFYEHAESTARWSITQNSTTYKLTEDNKQDTYEKKYKPNRRIIK
jgi:hypothetical protein